MREVIKEMADELAGVPGVSGVMLGGSRARGEHRPESDWDLGVYYRGDTFDLDALRALAGPDVEVAGPGGWAPGSTAAPGCASTGWPWTGSCGT